MQDATSTGVVKWVRNMVPAVAVGLAMGMQAPSYSQAPETAADGKAASDSTQSTVQRNAAFEQLMAKQTAPATIRLKDLSKSWRRVIINESSGDNNPYAYTMRGPMYQDIMADLGIGVYFTKWQSITLGQETYLIAYRIDNNVTQADLQDAMRQIYGGHGANEAPVVDGPRRFPANTTLRLSLLNLRTVGSLVDIQVYDPARTIMQPADMIAASDNNLRRIAGYMPRLSQFERYGMRGLPLRNIREARQAFHNFFHAPDSIFTNPATRETYQPNTLLAGKRPKNISNRAELAIFFEARPASDGKRGVVFLDGHTDRIPEWKWPQIKARQPQGLTPAQLNTASGKNLATLGRQLRRYVQYTGALPSMQDAYVARRALSRYFGYNTETWVHPSSRMTYRVNSAVSKKNLRDIANQAQVVAFYEPVPGKDGKIGAVFLDGHVARIPQARWASVKAVAIRTKKA